MNTNSVVRVFGLLKAITSPCRNCTQLVVSINGRESFGLGNRIEGGDTDGGYSRRNIHYRRANGVAHPTRFLSESSRQLTKCRCGSGLVYGPSVCKINHACNIWLCDRIIFDGRVQPLLVHRFAAGDAELNDAAAGERAPSCVWRNNPEEGRVVVETSVHGSVETVCPKRRPRPVHQDVNLACAIRITRYRNGARQHTRGTLSLHI